MAGVTVRVYGPLNDFLPPVRRQAAFDVRVDGPRSVKDLVESVGVPHPEIDLILLNGEAVGFAAAVTAGDRVAVFPLFRTIDISDVSRTRPAPAGVARFILDGHLAALTRRLRLMGVDTLCPAGADDAALASIAEHDGRILLTRDRDLLKRRTVSRGYFVRETRPPGQLVEVLRRFGPVPVEPFSRCLRCNGMLVDVAKADVASVLPPQTRLHHDRFRRCDACGHIYWQGAHWHRLIDAVERALEQAFGA